MEAVEPLRRRVDVLQELREVVKTMKTIAAVTIRQYEKAVVSLRRYSRTIEMGMQVVMRGREAGLEMQPVSGRCLTMIVFGSEFGMCGQFNEVLTSFALSKCKELQIPERDRSVIAVGTRALSSLEEIGAQVESWVALPGSVGGITSRVQELLSKIEDWQCRGGTGRIMLFHNEPVSGLIYRPKAVAFLPIEMEWQGSLEQKAWPSRVLPTFTMGRLQLIHALLRQYLFVMLYRAFAESLASENMARLACMQAAEDNIEDRLQELRLQYNQLRQAAITEELLDIVAGFEVLTEKP